MLVEIWSDIMCPFCYIGKQKFEKALEQFPFRDHIKVEWKSYLLNPELETGKYNDIYEYLDKEKDYEREEAEDMNSELTAAAREIGLDYHFEKIVVSNTLKAHKLLHYAQEFGKQNEAEELLFRAYFTEGKDVDDIRTLKVIGDELGLETENLEDELNNEEYAEAVQKDIYEAGQLDIRSVPFFVFNNKYGVKGAQEPELFLDTFEKAFAHWREHNPGVLIEVAGGKSCSVDGECDQI